MPFRHVADNIVSQCHLIAGHLEVLKRSVRILLAELTLRSELGAASMGYRDNQGIPIGMVDGDGTGMLIGVIKRECADL